MMKAHCCTPGHSAERAAPAAACCAASLLADASAAGLPTPCRCSRALVSASAWSAPRRSCAAPAPEAILDRCLQYAHITQMCPGSITLGTRDASRPSAALRPSPSTHMQVPVMHRRKGMDGDMPQCHMLNTHNGSAAHLGACLVSSACSRCCALRHFLHCCCALD